MTEKIGNVTLDLSVYSGKDLYSDGDIEERLLELVESGQDIEEILMASYEWPILYHLSPIRKNILEWYPFRENARLLEIGAGCGALSGLFCERCESVTAVELSKRRSTINATRNSEYENLTIKVGNFQDMTFEPGSFDYVTLIGVLEYSINYINSDNPFGDMLRSAKRLLAPGGVLLLAIENKYGLKYFAGACEDHTARRFEGIEGYPNTDFVRTFSRKSLQRMFTEAGFETKFYYPYPDYKLPTVIYSDSYLPGKDALLSVTPAYDNERFSLFDERLAFNEMVSDGYFPDFANSFLVECR